MVVLFVVLTIIVFLTVDFFIQRRKLTAAATSCRSTALPLSRLSRIIPRGTFLQPSFTWSKILDDGSIAVGLHPLLIGLVGEPDEITMTPPGALATRGAALMSIRKGNRTLQVRSPLNGEVAAINNQVLEDATCESVSRNWLFIMKPDNVAEEIPRWMIADKAEEWMKTQYQQIREFLIGYNQTAALGTTMADGGDIPAGILAEFDDAVWNDFQKAFCDRQG